jgi:hypothetical protein
LREIFELRFLEPPQLVKKIQLDTFFSRCSVMHDPHLHRTSYFSRDAATIGRLNAAADSSSASAAAEAASAAVKIMVRIHFLRNEADLLL